MSSEKDTSQCNCCEASIIAGPSTSTCQVCECKKTQPISSINKELSSGSDSFVRLKSSIIQLRSKDNPEITIAQLIAAENAYEPVLTDEVIDYKAIRQSNNFNDLIIRCIESKFIPLMGFVQQLHCIDSNFDLNTKVEILKAAWPEFILCNLAFRSMTATDGLLIKETSSLNDNHFYLSESMAHRLGIGSYYDRIWQELVLKFRDLNLNRLELAIIKGILLFKSDIPVLSREISSKLDILRDILYSALSSYSINRFPNDPTRFSKLLLRLSSIRMIALKCVEYLVYLKACSKDSSYKSLYDLAATLGHRIGYAARTVAGGEKHKLRPGFLESAFESQADSLRGKFNRSPCTLTLPVISLPENLDKSALDFIRDRCTTTPKDLEFMTRSLKLFLWSRPLPKFDSELVKSLKNVNLVGKKPQKRGDEAFEAFMEQVQHMDQLKKGGRALRDEMTGFFDQWKALDYTENVSHMYLVSRLAPNYAVATRIFYELRKRCPRYLPRNMFDFGSGLGTNCWAINTVWPVGCVREHYLVDASAHMVQLSEFLLRKRQEGEPSNSCVFPGIFLRRFLPESANKYDVVTCSNTLLELPNKTARLRVIDSLWRRTADFLILAELGTKAGFNAILEARQYFTQMAKDDPQVSIFAP
ncbi:Histone-lysine N-methyltransferase setd2, partial [Cichlidogyrus casuarinus]